MARQLHDDGKLIKFVVGEDDPICPPDECVEILGSTDMMKVSTGGHDPLSSRVGLAQLAEAISFLKSNEDS
jgi:hypothetical protein